MSDSDDLFGSDDGVGLEFFPAMRREAAGKLELVGEVVDALAGRYDVLPMVEHARLCGARLSAASRAGSGA